MVQHQARNGAGQHRAKFGAGSTVAGIAAASIGPELLQTAPGQNCCGQHQARIGVEYTKQGHRVGAPKMYSLRGSGPRKLPNLVLFIKRYGRT